MNDTIKGVPYNNPSLIPIGKYDIEIKQPIEIEVDNTGSYGAGEEGKWSIITKLNLDDGKEVTMVDLVTLKKVLDKNGLYPSLEESEVASLCQITLIDDRVTVRGDIVKVTYSN